MIKPLSFALAGAVLLSSPVLARDAHPDFTGAWLVQSYSPGLKPADGKPAPLTPAGQTAYKQRLAATAKGDRSWDNTSTCQPEGLPRIMIIKEPFEILQRDKEVAFVAQNRVPWRAFFDQALEADPDPQFQGHSVAKWVGPALVIESNGFHDFTSLDDRGLPQSEMLHLTQTYRLGKGGKTMTVTYRIEDPVDYTRPWTARVTFVKKPASFEMPEEVCAAKLETTAPKSRR